jgi:hypothetical protein
MVIVLQSNVVSPVVQQMDVPSLLNGLQMDPDHTIKTNASTALSALMRSSLGEVMDEGTRSVIESYNQARSTFSQMILRASQNIPILYSGPEHVERRELLAGWLGQLLQPLMNDIDVNVRTHALQAMVNLQNGVSNPSGLPASPFTPSVTFSHPFQPFAFEQPPLGSPISPSTDKKEAKRKDSTGRRAGQRCEHCQTTETPEWRRGPSGNKEYVIYWKLMC